MIKENKKRVTRILEDYPSTRDNDNQLLSIIWKQDYDELCHKKESQFSFFHFMQTLEDGKLTNFESVRRARQIIQKERVDLRGNNYKKRQEELEEEVREEIRELSFHEKFGDKRIKKEGDLFCE